MQHLKILSHIIKRHTLSRAHTHRQLYAPEAPRAAGCLLETALLHHNAARYRAAIEAYLRAYT